MRYVSTEGHGLGSVLTGFHRHYGHGLSRSYKKSGPQNSRMEIKTSLTSSALDKTLHNADEHLITCTVVKDNLRDIIPSEHCGQVLHQAVVLQVQYVVYVAASETGILYTSVVFVPSTVSTVCVRV